MCFAISGFQSWLWAGLQNRYSWVRVPLPSLYGTVSSVVEYLIMAQVVIGSIPILPPIYSLNFLVKWKKKILRSWVMK